ncbi:MAG: hypothetical protein GY754_46635 [bacterium]|nr:hypothetical protein [bacterium]
MPINIQHANLLQNKTRARQWLEWNIPGTGLTLVGYSRSNDRTCFYIPELKTGLDAGLYEDQQAAFLFLTHGHDDHVSDLAFFVKNKIAVYLPESLKKYADSYLKARRALNRGVPFTPEMARPYTLHGVSPHENEIEYGKENRYSVKIVECAHTVPCVGYCFTETIKKLKPEIEQLKADTWAQGDKEGFGRIMAKKRKAGIDVYNVETRPVFVYMGDTHPDVYADNPQVFDYPVIITECTFLYDTELETARRLGHTVWSELQPYVEAHPETHFLLTHFSLNYSNGKIIDFFKNLKQENPGKFKNITVWVNNEP